jgi:hypothetical protein
MRQAAAGVRRDMVCFDLARVVGQYRLWALVGQIHGIRDIALVHLDSEAVELSRRVFDSRLEVLPTLLALLALVFKLCQNLEALSLVGLEHAHRLLPVDVISKALICAGNDIGTNGLALFVE